MCVIRVLLLRAELLCGEFLVVFADRFEVRACLGPARRAPSVQPWEDDLAAGESQPVRSVPVGSALELVWAPRICECGPDVTLALGGSLQLLTPWIQGKGISSSSNSHEKQRTDRDG